MLLYRVAEISGEFDVDCLAEKLPYRNLLEWAYYFKHKDRSREKIDHYFAQLTSWVASKATGKAQKADKFYLQPAKPRGTDLRKMSSDEVKKMWAGFLGVKIEEKQ